jgi:hypothetical protein
LASAYINALDLKPERITPVDYLSPTTNFVGGITSVLVSRTVVANQLGAYMKARIYRCSTK